MSPASQVGMLIVNTLGSLVLLVFLLRFLLQLVRADFYNPISQFIVKFSNPLLIPLRRIIPGFGGLDIASLVLAYGTQVVVIGLALVIAGFQIPWGNVFVWAAIGLLSLVLNIYQWGIIIVAVASWIAPNSYNPVLILLNQILEPAIRPIRKILPDMGGLDLSPLFVLLLIQIMDIIIVRPLAAMAGLPGGLIFGI